MTPQDLVACTGARIDLLARQAVKNLVFTDAAPKSPSNALHADTGSATSRSNARINLPLKGKRLQYGFVLLALLLFRCPSAISWLIVTMRIFSINCVKWARTIPHRCVKGLKTFIPFFANGYALGSVLFPSCTSWVVAALLHRNPYRVFRRCGVVRCMAMFSNLEHRILYKSSTKTPNPLLGFAAATEGLAIQQLFGKRNFLLSAFALTKPRRSPIDMWGLLQHGQAAKNAVC